LAESHHRPGRNFTGILITVAGLPGKQAEVLVQLLPRANTIGVLTNPDNPAQPVLIGDIERSRRARSSSVSVR
jgi:hypothetical protein